MELYEELGGGEGGEELYEDVSATYNGHIPQPQSQPPLPRPRQNSRTLPNRVVPVRAAPPIPTRAPTTTLTPDQKSLTLNSQKPSPKKKIEGKGKKKQDSPKKPPPNPVSLGAGGLDMNEILKKRRQMSSNAFESLEKPKQDEENEEKHVAPWMNELKRSRSPSISHEPRIKPKTDDDEVPEFIRKRRSMSLHQSDEEEECHMPPLPVASKPHVAPKPRLITDQIPEETSIPPGIAPKPKPAPKPAPKPSEKPNKSPPLAPKPKVDSKPVPPVRKESILESKSDTTISSVSTDDVFEEQNEPPVPPHSKPPPSRIDSHEVDRKPPTLPPNPWRGSNNPPVPETRSQPPTIKPPPPIPTNEAPPIQLPQKPPTYKPPPIVPIQSHGEVTPTLPVLRYRRLPLPIVDIYNPPPVPSASTKPKIPSVPLVSQDKRPQLIPTESVIEDDEIYDDTVGVMQSISVNEDFEEGQEEVYDDIASTIPPTLPSRPTLPPTHGQLPPVPNGDPHSTFNSLPPPKLSVQHPPVVQGLQERDQPQNRSSLMNVDPEQEVYEEFSNPVEDLPPVPSPRSSLPPPPSPSMESSPRTSPTLQNKKGLTKEERRLIKEEERKQKEMKRLELIREKERKKRDEIRMKNRQKTMKSFKDYKLPDVWNPLFAVEILEDRKGSKDHMAVTAGEKLSVILIAHSKLPPGKYMVEKDDGSVGLVDESVTQRTVYQSAQQVGIQQEFGYGGEDIYEALETDVMGDGPPSLPPMNTPQIGTIPPDEDEPQELYEFLPDN